MNVGRDEVPDRFPITVAEEQVTGLAYPAAEHSRQGDTLLLGHGAGADQTSSFMVSFAHGLAVRGIETVTFNFPYTEQRRRVPDRAPRLEACYRAAITASLSRRKRLPGGRLFIGGKSLGGRIASHVAAARDDSSARVAGLVLLGYPLHPPGKPQQLRAAHLPRISVPMLFVQGSRDAFGTPEELRSVLASLPTATLYLVDGGDHSLAVRRKSAPSKEQIHTTIQDAIARWMATSTLSPQSSVLSPD